MVFLSVLRTSKIHNPRSGIKESNPSCPIDFSSDLLAMHRMWLKRPIKDDMMDGSVA
jgi:hypothetical protein